MPYLAIAQAPNTIPDVKPIGELLWRSMPTIAKEHTGSVKILKAGVTFEESGRLVKGDFVLDMKSISCQHAGSKELIQDFENHLKSSDFFWTDKFPEAKVSFIGSWYSFNPIESNQYSLAVLLQVKGDTKTMYLPARVVIDENGMLEIRTKLSVDRNLKTNHTSNASFLSSKDEIIVDELEISIRIDLKAIGC